MRRTLVLALAAVSTLVAVASGTAYAGDPPVTCRRYEVSGPVKKDDGATVEQYTAVLTVDACSDGHRVNKISGAHMDVVAGMLANRGWNVVKKKAYILTPYLTRGAVNNDGWTVEGSANLLFGIWTIAGTQRDVSSASLRMKVQVDGRCMGGAGDDMSEPCKRTTLTYRS